MTYGDLERPWFRLPERDPKEQVGRDDGGNVLIASTHRNARQGLERAFDDLSCHGESPVKAIHAIYKNGVFHPTEPVELPEDTHVEFEPRVVDNGRSKPTLDDVYTVLGKRFESGEQDVAQRHNEHQP